MHIILAFHNNFVSQGGRMTQLKYNKLIKTYIFILLHASWFANAWAASFLPVLPHLPCYLAAPPHTQHTTTTIPDIPLVTGCRCQALLPHRQSTTRNRASEMLSSLVMFHIPLLVDHNKASVNSATNVHCYQHLPPSRHLSGCSLLFPPSYLHTTSLQRDETLILE